MPSICGKCNPRHMKYEFLCAIRSCQSRGLLQTVKWLAEQAAALKCDSEKPDNDENRRYVITGDVDAEDNRTRSQLDNFTVAKSYFDLGEYDRAAHFLADDTSKMGYFLHMYSRYLSALRKNQLGHIDNHSTSDRSHSRNEELRVLRMELSKKHKNNDLDSFCLYLYGVILKKTSEGLVQQNEATAVLCQSVKSYPMNWSAWFELSNVIADQNMLSSLHLPKHWMRDFFFALTHVDLINIDDAFPIYNDLKLNGFSDSKHIKTQEAIAHHNKREFDEAIVILEDLRREDPYRIEHMDILSNMYYVKERKVDLAYLAHHCCEVDKYRVETCCIVGNYYSMQAVHEKAVVYFQRALKLDPNYLGAWTLMGHEYTEASNTPAAIQAYRNAVDLNRRDYRAWYGLGQTYELLKMPSYSLYYYKHAHRLRPFDSRMLMALGETYEALGRTEEAKMCYRKTAAVGDIEGMAHVRLAKLYKDEDKNDWAAYYYDKYLQQMDEHGIAMDTTAHTVAYVFLANYHLKTTKNYEAATYYAQKCQDDRGVREEGSAVLRQISQMRVVEGSKPCETVSEEFAHPTPSHVLHGIAMDTDSPSANFAPMKLSFSPGPVDSDTSNSNL